jgi:hypothetical protein
MPKTSKLSLVAIFYRTVELEKNRYLPVTVLPLSLTCTVSWGAFVPAWVSLYQVSFITT